MTAARDSLTSAVLRTGHVRARPATPHLMEPRGAFVSLHHGETLRGCIGYIDPVHPLLATVEEAARKAGTEDYRFDPVTPSELPFILIEISVLSALTEFHDPSELTIGTHGVLIESDRRRGVLLPQVALEHGWTGKEFLDHTTEKAGLPRSAWAQPGVTLYQFTAEIFHECTPFVAQG